MYADICVHVTCLSTRTVYDASLGCIKTYTTERKIHYLWQVMFLGGFFPHIMPDKQLSSNIVSYTFVQEDMT